MPKQKPKRKFSSLRATIIVAVLLAVGIFGVIASQAAGTSPSGVAMPVGDLNGFKQVFTDDFTTNVPLGGFKSVYGSKWSDYGDPSPDSAGLKGVNSRYSTSKTVSVQNNVLNVNTHYEGGFFYGDALLPMKNGARLGITYGKVITRFRVVNPIHGYKTAWLMWPDSGNWSDGEIDFPEGNLDGTIKGYSHCVGNPTANCMSVDSGMTYTSWHTAVIDWLPGKVTFSLDGVVLKSTTASVPTKSMHYVLQTESCYISTSACPTNRTGSSDVQLDWIAMYSYSPGTPGTSGTPVPTTTTTPTPTPTASKTPTPTPSPIFTIGDLNKDGHVNVFDLSLLLGKWGTADAAADLNKDGTVSIFDLSKLLSSWTG